MKVKDLSQVSEEPVTTLIAPGTYPVIVTDAQETIASTGTQGIQLDLELSEGSDKGRGLWDTCWVTEKAMWRVKKMLTALQFPIPDGEFDLDTAQLIGRRMFVVVDHEVFEGKTKARVVDMLPDEKFDPTHIETKPAEDGIPF
jgi:hypothetical protein